MSALRHRDDIDGLRAVAILPILLLHCGFSALRGGFVGVDVFFVISGYLITSIITRDLDAGRFRIADFYRRRFVRILPALLAMMAIVLAVGCWRLFPNPLRDLGRSAAATAAFGSNLYFYATTDYFAQASDTKPLVHTWSLGVEEQFYLLYPLLLIATRTWGQARRRAMLGALALLSLAIGVWFAAGDNSAGFFLLPGRIWELMLGGLVALGAFPRVESSRWRSAICCVALGGLLACFAAISGGWPFPVPFAIPPALGAAALIAYGERAATARLLGARPMRLVGLLSYSLYLWHRPIIAWWVLEHGATIDWGATAMLLAACFAAAGASYLLVERPFLRRWRSARGWRVHAVAIASLLGIAAAGMTIDAHADRIRQLPPDVRAVAGYLGYDTTAQARAQYSTDRCFTLPTGKPFEPACLRLAADRPNVVLLGDSHAAQFSQALRERLAGANLVQATAAGCRPLLHGRGLGRCRVVMERVFHGLDLGRVDMVILAGRWLDAEAAPLAETIRYFADRHIRVVVIGPMVEYDADFPDLLARALPTGDSRLFDRSRLRDRLALDARLAAIVRVQGADYISAAATECPGGRCRVWAAGAPIHFDHSHLTANAAAILVAAVPRPIRRTPEQTGRR